LAVGPDPIFTAIDKHRRAQSAHLAAIDQLARLENIHGADADGSITERPCHDENAAFETLLSAAATTLPGLLAKLAYLRAIAEGREAWRLDEREGTARDLLESFAGSIRTIWGVHA
jgi:hypothetical protein